MACIGIAKGVIEDEINIWSEKLNGCKKHLSDMQDDRKGLTKKRLNLQQIVGREISVFEYFRDKPDIDTQETREIFQLVTDIHNLELHSLELDEKLKIVEIEKEVKEIIRSFQPVEESSSHLSSWFRELKCLEQVCSKDCSVHFVNYHSVKQNHYLKFNFIYQGVALLIQIVSSLNKESSDLPGFKVTSDIHIENMEETACDLLQKKESVDNLMKFIKCGMEEDILPFVNNKIITDSDIITHVEDSDQ